MTPQQVDLRAGLGLSFSTLMSCVLEKKYVLSDGREGYPVKMPKNATILGGSTKGKGYIVWLLVELDTKHDTENVLLTINEN